jgi:hypothetical protein
MIPRRFTNGLSHIPKRFVLIFSCLIYVIVTAYLAAPRFYVDMSTAPRVSESAEVKAAFQKLATPSSNAGSGAVERREASVVVPYNLFVDAMTVLSLDYDSKEHRVINSTMTAKPFLRFDNLILYSGIWFVVTMVWVVLFPASVEWRVTSGRADTCAEYDDESSRDRNDNTTKQSAESLLSTDVSLARRLARELYSRSSLMLAGGVVMAFVGVGVFYVSLSQTQYDSSAVYALGGAPFGGLGLGAGFGGGYPYGPSGGAGAGAVEIQKMQFWVYAQRAIRPTFVLLFIEGISWFLLRQYRALIEDYKAFHRMYLKRANYLIALKILDSPDLEKPQAVFVASLLAEDLSGKLQEGETTENIQGVKCIEPNPIFHFFESILSGIGRTK